MLPSVLRNRDFAFFWGGLVVSAIGSEFTNVALLWQVYLLTNSALEVGLLGLARAIPQMSVALFGGLLADAIDRRRLMMATQLIQFGVSGLLAVVTLTGSVTQLTLYLASGLLALSGSLEAPARQAIVPNLVSREDLTSAIALNTTQRSLGSIVGPSLGGLLLAFAGPAWCYGIDALSWLVMLAALILIKLPPRVRGGRRGVSLEALRGGIAFVGHNPVILSLMALDFGATFFGSPRALLPVYARDILQVGPTGLGILYAATSIGALLGAASMGILPRRDRAGLWVLIGVIIYGVGTCIFAFSHLLWLSMLMLAVTGAGNTISAILRGTINQSVTPDELRGRVAAVNSIFVMGGPQLGQFESGVVAALASTEISAFTGGLGVLLVVAAVGLVPRVRQFQLAAERVRKV